MPKLQDLIFKIIRYVRAPIMRVIKPKFIYDILNKKYGYSNPISYKNGFDRGLPVDRYYIENFLWANKDLITGVCLEIHDSNYTKKYGGNRITKAVALDIDKKNKLADIYGDLRNLSEIQDNVYDTIILTHTIGMIDNYEAVISECYRVLKPGGWILVTAPSAIGAVMHPMESHWRFTFASARFVFSKYFKSKLEVKTFGNLISAQAFLIGLATEELSINEIERNDQCFPIIVTVKAQK